MRYICPICGNEVIYIKEIYVCINCGEDFVEDEVDIDLEFLNNCDDYLDEEEEEW